jgi:hypothetical protein
VNIQDSVIEIGDSLIELAAQRDKCADLAVAVKEAKAKFEANNAGLFESAKTEGVKLMEIDERVRKQALDLFEETQDKKICPGVEIKIVKELSFKPDEALAWAIDHNLAVKLDVDLFRKLALVVPMPDIAALIEGPKVFISSKLGAVANE